MSVLGAALHRVIRISTRREPGECGVARVAVEDDHHHFRVELHHDGHRLTAAYTQALRAPFTLCAAAGSRLEQLVGIPLAADMTAAFRHAEARLQCTHQFDIAALAMAAAARKEQTLRYDVCVLNEADGTATAALRRNGSDFLSWSLAGDTITEPAPFEGRHTGSGFTQWVKDVLDEETAEAALVLRRVVFIFVGRQRIRSPSSHAPASGGCWVQQPMRNQEALVIPNSVIRFSNRPTDLTAADSVWLDFA